MAVGCREAVGAVKEVVRRAVEDVVLKARGTTGTMLSERGGDEACRHGLVDVGGVVDVDPALRPVERPILPAVSTWPRPVVDREIVTGLNEEAGVVPEVGVDVRQVRQVRPLVLLDVGGVLWLRDSSGEQKAGDRSVVAELGGDFARGHHVECALRQTDAVDGVDDRRRIVRKPHRRHARRQRQRTKHPSIWPLWVGV